MGTRRHQRLGTEVMEICCGWRVACCHRQDSRSRGAVSNPANITFFRGHLLCCVLAVLSKHGPLARIVRVFSGSTVSGRALLHKGGATHPISTLRKFCLHSQRKTIRVPCSCIQSSCLPPRLLGFTSYRLRGRLEETSRFHWSCCVVSYARCRLRASPVTGLVGTPENALIRNYFDCLRFMPVTPAR